MWTAHDFLLPKNIILIRYVYYKKIEHNPDFLINLTIQLLRLSKNNNKKKNKKDLSLIKRGPTQRTGHYGTGFMMYKTVRENIKWRHEPVVLWRYWAHHEAGLRELNWIFGQDLVFTSDTNKRRWYQNC